MWWKNRPLWSSLLTLCFLFGTVTVTYGQAQGIDALQKVLEWLPVQGILSNSVTNLHAEGDTLWVGPRLNVTADGGQTWWVADVDSIREGRQRVFSIDAEGRVIWVGLGFTATEQTITGETETIPSAGGFVFSEDGGETWTYRFPPLDEPDDTVIVYGVSRLPALPVIVPQQSPPYDIDIDPRTGTVWTANWAAGIRRSDDKGRTWQRVVLPPDTLDEIRPDQEYHFTVAPERVATEEANNFLAFSVLVDETGTIWAGTAAGVNKSLDGLAWRRFYFDGTPGSLIGNWVISIEEQPVQGRNPIWMACWRALDPREQFGVTVTRDGGATFETVLVGERIYDFAFRGDTVYAAGANGLFISENGGRSWYSVAYFADRDDPAEFIGPNVPVYAVATTSNALWVGTAEGLLKSEDGGQTWNIFRVFVPLHPDTPSPRIPDVETFAYPNPFSPLQDRVVRIRFALDVEQHVRIRVFDFNMHLVREVWNGALPAGEREVLWDGTDDGGTRLANGVYFYSVEAGRQTFRGKILVIE